MAMPSFPSTFASWWLNFTTPLIVLIYPIRIHGPSYFTHIVVCVTLSVAAVILAASPFLPMQLVIVMAVVAGTSTVFFPLIAVIASSACASGLITYVVWTSVSQQYTYFHLGVGVVALLTAAATLASRRLFDNWQMLYCPIIGGYLIASAAGCQWWVWVTSAGGSLVLHLRKKWLLRLEEEEWAKNMEESERYWIRATADIATAHSRSPRQQTRVAGYREQKTDRSKSELQTPLLREYRGRG
ncbi:hypothetical protein FOL46_002095 [Perkinsus olseni]|uniref:Transmembrane protein n=1 Tax=Perkinsus olseni TaxID=32597 RepID=A0A7J6KRJ3_PEROL|nr:hypothetical protein FOL46_002095 [Perkinsus olseni]